MNTIIQLLIILPIAGDFDYDMISDAISELFVGVLGGFIGAIGTAFWRYFSDSFLSIALPFLIFLIIMVSAYVVKRNMWG